LLDPCRALSSFVQIGTCSAGLERGEINQAGSGLRGSVATDFLSAFIDYSSYFGQMGTDPSKPVSTARWPFDDQQKHARMLRTPRRPIGVCRADFVQNTQMLISSRILGFNTLGCWHAGWHGANSERSLDEPTDSRVRLMTSSGKSGGTAQVEGIVGAAAAHTCRSECDTAKVPLFALAFASHSVGQADGDQGRLRNLKSQQVALLGRG
jgi:hypothetical protein